MRVNMRGEDFKKVINEINKRAKFNSKLLELDYQEKAIERCLRRVKKESDLQSKRLSK